MKLTRCCVCSHRVDVISVVSREEIPEKFGFLCQNCMLW